MEDLKKTYYMIICAAWDLLKSNIETQDFDSVVKKLQDLEAEHKGQFYFPFMKEMMKAVSNELFRLSMEGKE